MTVSGERLGGTPLRIRHEISATRRMSVVDAEEHKRAIHRKMVEEFAHKMANEMPACSVCGFVNFALHEEMYIPRDTVLIDGVVKCTKNRGDMCPDQYESELVDIRSLGSPLRQQIVINHSPTPPTPDPISKEFQRVLRERLKLLHARTLGHMTDAATYAADAAKSFAAAEFSMPPEEPLEPVSKDRPLTTDSGDW